MWTTIFTSILNVGSGLLGKTIGGGSGKPNYSNEPQPPANDNSVLLYGLGATVILLLVLIWVFKKGKK